MGSWQIAEERKLGGGIFVKVKRMLLYASLCVVPCNRRLRRQSNPGQRRDIRKNSGDFLQFSVNYVDLLSMI